MVGNSNSLPSAPGPRASAMIDGKKSYLLAFLDDHAALLMAAEGTQSSRLASRVYALYRTHIALLLQQAGCGNDSPYLADVLLAPLAAPTFKYHRELRGLSLAECQASYEDLVARLVN